MLDELGDPPQPCKMIAHEVGVQDVDQWAASHLSPIQSEIRDIIGDDMHIYGRSLSVSYLSQCMDEVSQTESVERIYKNLHAFDSHEYRV